MTEFFSEKRVLVAGASGFVGYHLSKVLVALGAEVVGTYHRRERFERVEGAAYLQCDLTSYEDCLTATTDIDYVFMAAANTSGAAVMDKKPLTHLTPNVIMNAQILAASYENSVEKFCFISSNTVYPVTDHAVTEDDVNHEFFSKYFVVGWMKLFSEKMCEMYSGHISKPMKTITVRPGNIYGPHDKFTWKESKVIAALVRRTVEKQDPFIVWGDGNDLKDFIYIDDFIDGLIQSFIHAKDNAAINIASSVPVTIKEVLNSLLKIEHFDSVDLVFDDTKPTMIPKRLINTDKLRTLTNWQPTTSLESGLTLTVNWYKGYFANKTPEEMYDN